MLNFSPVDREAFNSMVVEIHDRILNATKNIKTEWYHAQYHDPEEIAIITAMHDSFFRVLIEAGSSILNIGAGVGIFEYLAIENNVDILGVDIEDDFFEAAREGLGVTHLVKRCNSIFKPSFVIDTDKKFDNIFLIRFPFISMGKVSQEDVVTRLLPYKKEDGAIYLCNPYPEIIG